MPCGKGESGIVGGRHLVLRLWISRRGAGGSESGAVEGFNGIRTLTWFVANLLCILFFFVVE